MPPSRYPSILENLMDKIKQHLVYIIMVGLFIIGLAAVSLWAGFSKAEDENIGAIRPWGLERHQCQTATTTPVYKIGGAASSTCVVSNMDQISSADFRFMVYSSTTPPTLSYAYYVSNDPTIPDWYLVGYGQSKFSTSTAIGFYPFESFPISNLAAKVLKIEWAVASTTTSGPVDAADTYLEVIKDPK